MNPKIKNARILTSPKEIEQMKATALAAEQDRDTDTALNCAAILTLSAGNLNVIRPQLARFTWTWLIWFLDTYYPDTHTVA